MQQINWIQVIIGFLSGGAFGALIKQYFDSRRNRIQPIGHSLAIKPIFESIDNKLINSEIILKDEHNEYKFSKLYAGTLIVLNSGLTDYQDFIFGITASEKIKFIQINFSSPDRHHAAEFTERPSLNNQVNSFDITLRPFNRKDSYTFDFLMTSENDTISETDLQISSPKPVRWVKLISTSEILFEMANRTMLEIVTDRVNKKLGA